MKNINKKKKYTILDSKLMFRLMSYFSVIILLMFAIAIYTIEYTKSNNIQVTNSITKMTEVQEIGKHIDAMINALTGYYNSQDMLSIANFNNEYRKIRKLTTELKASRSNTFIYRDIDAIVQTIYEDSIKVVKKIDSGTLPTFFIKPDLTKINMLQSYLYEQIYLGKH